MDASSNVSTQSGGLSKDDMLVMMFNMVMKGGKPNQEIDIEMLQPKKKPKALPAPESTEVPEKKEQPASGSTLHLLQFQPLRIANQNQMAMSGQARGACWRPVLHLRQMTIWDQKTW